MRSKNPLRFTPYALLKIAPSKLGRLTRQTRFLRKEVIQPQVPLRLPCYDFTPITNHTLVRCPCCQLAHALLVQPTFVV